MSVLENNLQAILNEKNLKIIPENIKKGITIFDISGTLDVAEESAKTTAEPCDILMGKTAFSKGMEVLGTMPYHDIYKFNSVEEMNRFTLAKDKEYGLVYNTSVAGISPNTTYTSINFPSAVILTDFQYSDIPQEVLTKAKELAFGFENYIILQNTSTKEYYIPYQTNIYNQDMFTTNGWKLTWYKESWSFHSPCWTVINMVKYNAYSHTFDNTKLSTKDTNSTVLYDWGTYKLEPVYASKDILIREGHDNWKSGDLFYRSSDILTTIGSYPNTLPYVRVDKYNAEFFFNGFTKKVTYASIDGVVYTRTDTQSSTLSCNVNIASSVFHRVLPYFMKSGSNSFDFIGLYQYYNNKWSLAPTNLNATASDLIAGKKAYSGVGVIDGALTNNGTLNYTPSNETQVIPSGYTSGGTILGDANLVSHNIKAGSSIFGVTGTAPITFASLNDMYNNTSLPEDTFAIVYGTTYVGTYRLDNGVWTQIGDSSQEQQIMDALNSVSNSTDQYEGNGGTDDDILGILNRIIEG